MSTNSKPVIPYNAEAETVVLASILFDAESHKTVINALLESDFYRPDNATIFKSFVNLDKQNVTADLITLREELVKQGLFEQVGGKEKLVELATAISTTANLKHHIKIIQENSYRRRCIKLADEIKSHAMKNEIDKLLFTINLIQDDYIKKDEITNLPVILKTALEETNTFNKSGDVIKGVPTGFKDLDLKLGGLQNTDLIYVAGRPSMGKTAFVLDIIRSAAKNFKNKNKCVVFFSLEMSKEKLALRTYSSELNINNENFKFGTLSNDDYKKMADKTEEFENNMQSVFIDDNSTTTINEMYSTCHNIKTKYKKEIGLIAIDYIQLMRISKEINSNKMLDMNREMTEISNGLKKLAKDFDCPVVALSQLSRACESRNNKRPMLSDLRDSGSLEQDADVVMFLYRDEYYNPQTEQKNIAEVSIAKNREGSTGTIDLCFLKQYTSFRDLYR